MQRISGPEHTDAGAVLRVENLSVEFAVESGAVHAVRDISLTARRGRITALVGESGSGKSVTSLAVMGILDKNAAVTGGRILLSGRDVLAMEPKEHRRYAPGQAGIIFQEPADSLNPLYTVGNQVVEAIRIHQKISRRDACALAVEQLRAVALPEPELLMKQYPFTLSGGMCQRVMIAIAAVKKPRLLIADEPTTALDVTVQAQILRLLAGMRDRDNTAVLLITHDLGVVAEVADDVYIMKDGGIVESGSVHDIFHHAGNAYTQELLEAAL